VRADLAGYSGIFWAGWDAEAPGTLLKYWALGIRYLSTKYAGGTAIHGKDNALVIAASAIGAMMR
jgi:hypothetical protein